MNFLKSQKKRFIIFLIVCFAVMFVSYLQTYFVVPEEITLLEGQESIYNFKSPFFVSVKADKPGVLKVNNDDFGKIGSFLKLSGPLSFKTQSIGKVILSMRIFGLIPFHTMKVDIIPNKTVVACGNTIGVKIKIKGILVIGLSDVETVDGKKTLPARQGGIKIGDLVEEVNNKKINSINELIDEVDRSRGKEINLKLKRGGTSFSTRIMPVKSEDDRKFHIGLWVRESTAGIGTLTFYDPETKCFAALGHGIADIDTGKVIPIGSGEVLESRILSVKKGKPSSPGELRGVFIEGKNKLGTIQTNCEYGIYGKLNNDVMSRISQKKYPIALRSQIREGPASILSNIDGNDVEEFNIEILKLSKQSTDGSKGMVIKVTDKRLLEATGGIVQGMSGSPILQDGRIIGAVTHVLVNDPTKGYGIFIERMIKNLTDKDMESFKLADAS